MYFYIGFCLKNRSEPCLFGLTATNLKGISPCNLPSAVPKSETSRKKRPKLIALGAFKAFQGSTELQKASEAEVFRPSPAFSDPQALLQHSPTWVTSRYQCIDSKIDSKLRSSFSIRYESRQAMWESFSVSQCRRLKALVAHEGFWDTPWLTSFLTSDDKCHLWQNLLQMQELLCKVLHAMWFVFELDDSMTACVFAPDLCRFRDISNHIGNIIYTIIYTYSSYSSSQS